MKLAAKLILAQALASVTAAVIAATGTYLVYSQHALGLPWLIVIFTLTTFLAVCLSHFAINRSITRQISALDTGMSRVSLGDLSQSVAAETHDEIGTLAHSFNDMTTQLRQAYQALEVRTNEAKQERAQLAASINSLRQGFVLLDAKHNVIMANDVANTLVQESVTASDDHKSAERHTPLKHIDELVSILSENLELTKRIDETLRKHRPAKIAGLAMRTEGRYFNLYLSPVISDRQAIGCALLVEDVTEERIIQRSRDEFFSIASHELRTPLTVIRGNTAMMPEYFPELKKNKDLMTMVDDIHDSAERLIEIVNDFLDTSSLEQNKMKFTLTDFAIEPIIERILYEMASASRDKKVRLEYDHTTTQTLPNIYADKGRITQILYNLIGNALKFTDKGKVLVNCMVQGSYVKIYVTDTGQGISADGRHILFHKFQQSTDDILTRDNTRGTGLGLYISKLLIERMHGKIELEHSEVGKGSTFSITIPVAVGDAPTKDTKKMKALTAPKSL